MTTPPGSSYKATRPRSEKSTLAAIGLGSLPFWRRFRTESILVLFSLALALLIAGLSLSPGEPKRLLQALAAASAAAAVALGYLQWRAGRHEVSFDSYYGKLDTANQKFDAWRVEALKDDPGELQSHLNTMFVFAELDNLEYVLEKLKLGYVRQELAERAIRNFRSRCAESPDFCEKVLWAVGREEGSQRAQGYERTTREAARHIVTGCRR